MQRKLAEKNKEIEENERSEKSLKVLTEHVKGFRKNCKR